MTDKALKKHRGSVVFAALETYSLMGGLQRFNRRVINSLVSRAKVRQEPRPYIQVLRDAGSIPVEASSFVVSYSTRPNYLVGATVAAVRAQVLILGHINLLPLAALIRCFRRKLPVLLFVHGDEAWNAPNRRQKRWYDRIILRTVDRIASVSYYTADTMAREYGVDRAKFRILPNAVDYIDPRKAESSNGSQTILTVTRMGSGDREKNVDQMLRAFALIKERIPSVRYEIVGDGPLRSELEQLSAELGVEGNVFFLGRLDDEQLNLAYSRASVFALPSSKEGFGIVYLEAWLRSLPVLCSSFGASKEIVTDGSDGFVVDHRNPSAIADRLFELLTDRDLAHRFGQNGRRKVDTYYLDSSFRANLDAILDELQSKPVARSKKARHE